jgi:hypothetical protein
MAWSASILNLVPLKTESMYSDGAHVYHLLKGGRWADVESAFSMVTSSLITHTRPRDWDIGVITRAAGFLRVGMQGMLLRLYACMHYRDLNRIAEALPYLAQAEEMYPQVEKHIDADLMGEFVFANALLKRDPGAARLWWQRMEQKGVERRGVDYWRAQAAILWLDGKLDEARAACQRGQALCDGLPATGGYDLDRDDLRLLSQVIAARPAFVPPPLPAGRPAAIPA